MGPSARFKGDPAAERGPLGRNGGWPTAIVTGVLSTALAVCVLVKLIKDNEFQTIWAWIGFGISLALMVTAWLRVRFRWGLRRAREEPEPRFAPPPQVQPPSAR
jgi:hypothetical protein